MNGVFRITIDVQFSEELFFCCSTVDCLHLLVIVLLCVFGNGMGMGITEWESHGMGIKLRFGNRNGKGCKLTAWKWEGMRMKKSIPGHLQNSVLQCTVLAKFHYTDTDTDPHGPNGVSPQKSPCPCRARICVRVVEFSCLLSVQPRARLRATWWSVR